VLLRFAAGVLIIMFSFPIQISVAQLRPSTGPGGIASESREDVSDLQCEMFCSGDKRPTVELRWDPVKDKRVRDRTQQRIETTVYKKGFLRGEFTALALGAGPPAPRLGARFAGVDRQAARNLLASLELTVTKIHITEIPHPSVAVRAQGIEPGLTYFWRLSSRIGNTWLTSQTVRCQAPVCPIDAAVKSRTP